MQVCAKIVLMDLISKLIYKEIIKFVINTNSTYAHCHKFLVEAVNSDRIYATGTINKPDEIRAYICTPLQSIC